MNYTGIDWHLRRRACQYFGHKSKFPCARCGVKGEGGMYDISACLNEHMMNFVIGAVFASSPVLRYLKEHR